MGIHHDFFAIITKGGKFHETLFAFEDKESFENWPTLKEKKFLAKQIYTK